MNAGQHPLLLRQFLHDKSTSDTVKSLKSRSACVVRYLAVGAAYAKLSKLSADVHAAYEAQDIAYDGYSQHTEEQIFNARMEANLEGEVKGKLQVAEKMIQSGVALNNIQAYCQRTFRASYKSAADLGALSHRKTGPRVIHENERVAALQ